MVVNQVLLLLLKPQPYVPAKTFATNCKCEFVLEKVAPADSALRPRTIEVASDIALFSLWGATSQLPKPHGSLTQRDGLALRLHELK